MDLNAWNRALASGALSPVSPNPYYAQNGGLQTSTPEATNTFNNAQYYNIQEPPQTGYVQGATYNPYAEQQRQAQAQAAAEAAARGEEVAAWDDNISALNRLLGRTSTTRDQGLAQIGDSYNQNVNRTNEAQSRTLRDFGIKRADTEAQKGTALNRIDEGARTGYSSLQRMLGMAGSGVSSAARELVPWAVSKEAGKQRSGTLDTFGRNTRNIDIAEGDAKSQYGNALEDLLRQRREKESGFLGGIYETEADLNAKLGDAAVKRRMAEGADYTTARAARAPFQAQVDQRMSALDNLFNQYRTPTYNINPVNVKTPELSGYTVDPLQIQGGQQGAPSEVASYLPFFNQREDERRRLG